MKRVMVTGATGFIGFHCLKLLFEKGYEVHAISPDGVIPEAMDSIIWHKCDLLNSEAVSEMCERICATHLMHLAWFVNIDSEENLRWVLASMHLVRAFKLNGGNRITFAGTCFEYDANSGVLREDCTPVSPHTVYGASKHTLHELVKSFSESEDLSFAWARIFYLYGPRENPRRLVASIINDLLTGKNAACSEGRQVRDYLHVYDVASALVAILDSEVTGALNIGSGVPISVRELATTTADLMSSEQQVDFGAIPSSSKEPLVIVANTEKLINQTGWKPRFGLIDGLEHTIEWWRNMKSMEEKN